MKTLRCWKWMVLFLSVRALAGPLDTGNLPVAATQPAPVGGRPVALYGGPIALPAGSHVAIVKVRGLIYGYTLESLKRRVDQAVQAGASLVVIELDTPGGLVDSGLKISKFIKSMQVPTVAWINPEAYSAGILIAAACDQIVMAPASATGDCAPIVPGQNLSPTERAKALSPILEEFRDSARINRYDEVLFHAMCELGVQVYEIQNPETGRHKLVNQADYRDLVGGDRSDDPQPLPNTSDRPASAVSTSGRATATTAASQNGGQWVLVRKVHDGTTLLTLSQQRALDLRLAQAIVRDTFELRQFLGAATLTTVPESRTAVVAYWLTQPWVRAVLVMAMLIGAFAELQAPGLGVAGMVAVTALLLLLIAPYLVGLAQVWHVVLFLIGVLLMVAEVLVIPGFGIAGIGGLICMLIGLVLMVVPTHGQGWMPLPGPGVAQRLRDSVLFTLLGIIGSGVAFYYMAKCLGGLPVLNRLVLTHSSAPQADGNHVSGDEVIGRGQIAPGATGHVLDRLRPTGRAEFDGHIVDVVSFGQWIESGRSVRVVEVHGNRIVVEAESDR